MLEEKKRLFCADTVKRRRMNRSNGMDYPKNAGVWTVKEQYKTGSPKNQKQSLSELLFGQFHDVGLFYKDLFQHFHEVIGGDNADQAVLVVYDRKGMKLVGLEDS